jgi:hypothetical protein
MIFNFLKMNLKKRIERTILLRYFSIFLFLSVFFEVVFEDPRVSFLELGTFEITLKDRFQRLEAIIDISTNIIILHLDPVNRIITIIIMFKKHAFDHAHVNKFKEFGFVIRSLKN